jgi:hypothetical protein
MKLLFLLSAMLVSFLSNVETQLNFFVDSLFGNFGNNLSLAGVNFIPAGFNAENKEGKPYIMKCLDGVDLLDEDCDTFASPGTSQVVYYAFANDVDEWAEITTPVANLEDAILLTSGWVMKAGKFFHSISVEVDQNNAGNEFTGEYGSGNFNNTARIFIKTNKAEAVGLAAHITRRKSVWAIPLNDGTINVIGTKEHPAYVKATFDSLTDTATDPRGWEFLIKSVDTMPWRLDPTVSIPLSA